MMLLPEPMPGARRIGASSKCWADLPANSEREVVAMFEASLHILVGAGKESALFW